MTEEENANIMGYIAGKLEEPKEDNPYKPGTSTYTAWLTGWKRGRKVGG